MGDSLENQDTSVETQNVAVVDYGEFANYILKAASILLPEEDIHAVPPALAAALDEKVNQDCIKKFLSDPQIPALYVQRSCSKGNSEHFTRMHSMYDCAILLCAMVRIDDAQLVLRIVQFECMWLGPCACKNRQ